MEDRGIPDSRITASSVHDDRADIQPWVGRLNNPNSAWIPQLNEPDNWLKIDLSRKMIVTKIATQGRPRDYYKWVTSYKISFSQDDRAWEPYKENGVEKVKGILHSEIHYMSFLLVYEFLFLSVSKPMPTTTCNL